MTTTIPTSAAGLGSAHGRGQRKSLHGSSDAIKVWAAIGAVTLAVIISGIVRWILSAEFVATPTGVDPYPYLITLRVVELLSALFLLYYLVTCVVQPWIRERRFIFDGRLLIGCLGVHFVDPMFNYFSPTFLQNAYSLNRGSWANFIPGYASPSGSAGYVEGILWAAALYGLFGIAAAKIGGWMLAKLRERYVGISNVAAYGVLFIAIAIGDLIVENFFVRAEIYIFWGAWSPVTLWAGEVYQFPLYETLLATIYALGFVWLRDSRDDEGRSIVERGVDRIKLGPSMRSLLSFCAVVGFSLVWSIVSYFGPYMFISMKADQFPPIPSYLRGGAFCGLANTPRCPSQYLKQIDDTFNSVPQR